MYIFNYFHFLILLYILILNLNLIIVGATNLTLTILHTNDVHSRFLQTNKYSGSCSERDQIKNLCYGGFARLHAQVKEIRKTHPNVVYLSGGDYFQGTVWYTLHKWKIVSHFVNKLGHTAMALGNHEFDDNVDGLVPFLESVTFPVLAANIDDFKEPTMQGKFNKSIVIEYEGRKVGIIGYTTVETKAISHPGELRFEDELTSVSLEAKRLNDIGIKILIAVGHAGYDVDMKIATAPYIDVVVGGHTNTFLYSGDAPDDEKPLGEYPTMITQSNGRQVPVVQAYAFGKYLGYLNVIFNGEGELISWNGNPILLNGSVPEDPEMKKELELWSANVSVLTKREVGKTRVFLDGSGTECRLRECNMGSLIADAMVQMNLKYADDLYWSDVTMAILNGGGIRGSIDEKSSKGSINLEDILTILPFQNTIDLIEIKGKYIRQAFEFSVHGYDLNGYRLPGKFLQTSGIRVVYNINKPNGERVININVLCSKCRVPKYIPLNDTEIYKLAIPTYTATGGDGYSIIKDNLIVHHLSGMLDSDMLVEYFKQRSPVVQGLDGRISFINDEPIINCTTTYTNDITNQTTSTASSLISLQYIFIIQIFMYNFILFKM